MAPRPPVLAHLRFTERAHELAGLDHAQLFTEIWRSNLWGADSSRSGLGSEDEATAHLRGELPLLLSRLKVRSLLDIPCGDFGWMSRTDLGLDSYIGADIVAGIVARNTERYGSPDGRIGSDNWTCCTTPCPRPTPFCAVIALFICRLRTSARRCATFGRAERDG